jgi:DNA polymerase III subunit alpha, Gram-positive type
MILHSNLISDSLLINETIELAKNYGGTVSAVDVVDYVMKIRKPEPNLAKLLVLDLVKSDPRLTLNDDIIEFTPINYDKRKLLETNYVVFDLETTGAKCPPCRITEIGAYRIECGQITDKFHTLINPECEIPTFISQLTGISNQMVRNEPKFRDVAADFLEFIGDSVLVAHNARFDMSFLNYEISLIYGNYRVSNPHLCTVQLSRRLISNIDNHKLNTVAEYFRISLENHHRASDDALATAKIFINLLEDLQIRGVRDLASARKFKN